MKKLLVIIVIVLSVAVIVTGKLHWDNKIQATVKTAQVEKPDNVKVKSTSEENQENMVKEVEAYSQNMPKEIQQKLMESVKSGEPVNLVIAGSSATPEEATGWPTSLKREIENTYGKNVLNVTIKEISEKTSTEVVQEQLFQEIIKLSPEVLLLEPFILYDNGELIGIEKRLENLTIIIEAIKVHYPDVVVLLQPPNPIYKAVHYPKEVERLEVYSKENNYIYLNHWEAWPDYRLNEFVDYVNEDGPTELGHKVWFEYLSEYFIQRSS